MMTDDTDIYVRLMRKKSGLALFSSGLEIFKKHDLLGFPDEMINVWLGTTASFIEMLLNNVKQVSLKKFEEKKSATVEKIERLKKQIAELSTGIDKLYI